eukprot:TRINITY_DN1522_c0_g1_i1.p1 TRINITY_DN1522_c0_g1~~TRINITY_DN1522_c0_g1_i1.p1  ORF type:complete len:103 (+),score=22.86 TRINITY_DN1522_c0_g1_i1:42-350(+)
MVRNSNFTKISVNSMKKFLESNDEDSFSRTTQKFTNYVLFCIIIEQFIKKLAKDSAFVAEEAEKSRISPEMVLSMLKDKNFDYNHEIFQEIAQSLEKQLSNE